jgi:DNA-binding response OmpR family regulator
MDQERWASLDSAELPINLVMVVEDDADSADVLKTILERDGFKVRKRWRAGSGHIRHAEAGFRDSGFDSAR